MVEEEEPSRPEQRSSDGRMNSSGGRCRSDMSASGSDPETFRRGSEPLQGKQQQQQGVVSAALLPLFFLCVPERWVRCSVALGLGVYSQIVNVEKTRHSLRHFVRPGTRRTGVRPLWCLPPIFSVTNGGGGRRS